jgi:methylglutaconyl-CoA hydratase
MAAFHKIVYAVDGPVARLTLNRPEKRNALDSEMASELRRALADSAKNSEVRVVLISGAGKDFSSGADLAALHQIANATVMENVADARQLADVFLDMRRHPRPIIAAVRGRALAGGCGIATAADIILASESAQFGYPEVKIGFVPAMVMAIVRRSVSEKRAFELLTSGEPFPARAALEIGMINRIFPDTTFDREVESYAAQLATRSSSALSLTKSLLYQIDSMSFEAALSAGVQTNAIARLTDDCRRGIEQFLKRC